MLTVFKIRYDSLITAFTSFSSTREVRKAEYKTIIATSIACL